MFHDDAVGLKQAGGPYQPLFCSVNLLHITEVGLGMYAWWVIACVPSPAFDTSVRMASYLNCVLVDISCSTYQPSHLWLPKHAFGKSKTLQRSFQPSWLNLQQFLLSLPPFSSLILSEGISEKFNFLADLPPYSPSFVRLDMQVGISCTFIFTLLFQCCFI